MPSSLIFAAAIFSMQAGGPPAETVPPATSESPGAIVVKGNPDREKATSSLLRQITPRSPDHPLARFGQAPCVLLKGLPRDIGVPFAERLRDDLQRVSLPAGADHCRPNLFIVVVSPERFQAIRRRHGISDKTRDPVIVEQNSQLHSSFGDPPQNSGPTGNVTTLNIGRASHIGTPIRLDVMEANLFFSSATLPGKTPVQLADYAMMRLFANLTSPAKAGVPTIMTLFCDDRDAAPGLTSFDNAYLSGLYDGVPSEQWGATLGRIRRILRTDPDAGADRETAVGSRQ